MSRVAQVDPDPARALRRLRAVFGPIEVLEVIDYPGDRNRPRPCNISDQDGGEDQLSPEP